MSSDDWAKIPKTKVDIEKISRRNPQHLGCDMCIKRSKKNPLFTGLYCRQHDHWFTWLNDDQIQFLKNLDDSIIDYTAPGAPQPPSVMLRLRDAPTSRL